MFHDMDTIEILKKQINKSALSLKQLLDKLESDGHIKQKNNMPVSEFVFNDLIAFLMLPVLCEIESIGKETGKSYLDALTDCFAIAVNESAFNDYVMQYVNRVGSSSGGDFPDIYPESFLFINNYDLLALKDNGQFYTDMKVNNPGRISDYYIMLIEATKTINENILKTNSSTSLSFIDASLRVMREEQVSL